MDPIAPGRVGLEVEDVQRRLGDLGHGHDPDELGLYGDGTSAAVRGFQRGRGLPATGIVDGETWEALVAASFALGDRLLFLTRPLLLGDDVRELQLRLNRLGFEAGYDDGRFGERTHAALRDFQANVGLPDDGILGPATLDALRRLHRDHQTALAFVARERAELRAAPRATVAGARVLLDPAHGPDDPGVVAPDGTPEHEVTWAICAAAEGQLSALGTHVVLTRGPGTTPDASARASHANQEAVEVVVSVHANGSASSAARGAAAYFFGTDGHVSERGRHLAELVLDAVTTRAGTADCRTHPSTMAVLAQTRAPATVVEVGHLTHPEEGARLTDPAGQRAIASAITEAVVRFLTESPTR